MRQSLDVNIIDWMIKHGKLAGLSAGKRLIQAQMKALGSFDVEMLYTLQQGIETGTVELVDMEDPTPILCQGCFIMNNRLVVRGFEDPIPTSTPYKARVPVDEEDEPEEELMSAEEFGLPEELFPIWDLIQEIRF